MRIDISVNEFADLIRKFDSYGLDWGQAHVLRLCVGVGFGVDVF